MPWSSDKNKTVKGEKLYYGKRSIAGSRREVYYKVIKGSPVRVVKKFTYHLCNKRPSPYYRFLSVINKHRSRDYLYSLLLRRLKRVFIRESALDAQEHKRVRAVYVSIYQSYFVPHPAQCKSCIDRYCCLSNTSLRTINAYLVLYVRKFLVYVLLILYNSEYGRVHHVCSSSRNLFSVGHIFPQELNHEYI